MCPGGGYGCVLVYVHAYVRACVCFCMLPRSLSIRSPRAGNLPTSNSPPHHTGAGEAPSALDVLAPTRYAQLYRISRRPCARLLPLLLFAPNRAHSSNMHFYDFLCVCRECVECVCCLSRSSFLRRFFSFAQHLSRHGDRSRGIEHCTRCELYRHCCLP